MQVSFVSPLHLTHTHTHTHTRPCTVSHPRWRYGSKCSSEEVTSSGAQLHVCQRSGRRRGKKPHGINDFIDIVIFIFGAPIQISSLVAKFITDNNKAGQLS